ncbi:MAG: class I SAM-dependent methyltransferase [Aeromicrobium sp.]
MSDTPRWFSDTLAGHSQWYIERFRKMAREGEDLAGEARLIDAIVAPGSRILDAGCGPGRVGGELFRRGHDVVGVDVDPELIAAAVEDHPGPTWLVADLATLDLPGAGHPEQFDAAVVAGNVMNFIAVGTESGVLRNLDAHVRTDGPIIIGFGLDRGYTIERFDDDIASTDLVVDQRFATWDLRPFTADSGFAVTILRAS